MKPKLNRDGLPIDRRDWTEEDWKDLHEAIEQAKDRIAKRHENQTNDTQVERKNT